MQQVLPDRALTASIRIRYQPIVRLADLRTEYVEVLARSASSTGAIEGPEPIIGAMTGEESSMRLTASIMRRALDQYEEFGFGEHDLRLAFNLPLDAMMHPDLVPRIESLREAAGLPAHNIRFELTERHPVNDLEAASGVIATLRHIGYDLALDDITPGMPHLAELMKMRIRAVKLDLSVVVSKTQAAQNFVREMVAKTKANGQDIIAEGIETTEMQEDMRARGVTHGQGFLFSKPLSAAALQSFLRS